MNPPKGYERLKVFLAGGNVSGVWLLVCTRCGAYVGDTWTHDTRCALSLPADPEREVQPDA